MFYSKWALFAALMASSSGAFADPERALRSSVVQIRINDRECGVGIFVSNKRIVTAGHLLKDVNSVGLSTATHLEEVNYDVAGEQAHVIALGDHTTHDIGMIELGTPWPDWSLDASIPLSAIEPESLAKLSLQFRAFHNTRAGWSCKGAHQGTAQGFHPVHATLVSARYYVGGAPARIRLTPSLDEAYSGSPLVAMPCGKKAACVVGVQSASLNDANVPAAFVAPFDSAVVRKPLVDVGVEVQDFVAYNAPREGLLVIATGQAQHYFSERVNGTAVVVAPLLEYAHPVDQRREFAVLAGASLGFAWFVEGQAEPGVVSPDGRVMLEGDAVDLNSGVKFGAHLGIEGLRQRFAAIRSTFGIAYSSYKASGDRTNMDFQSMGYTVGLGTRLMFLNRAVVDLHLFGTKETFDIETPQYTLTPGRFVTADRQSVGYAIGLSVGLGMFTYPWVDN